METRSTGQLVAGTVILIATLAAFLALELTNHGGSTPILLALITPVVGALLINAHQSASTRATDEKLSRLLSQTNGELDARMRDIIKSSLIDTGVASSAPPAAVVNIRHESSEDAS